MLYSKYLDELVHQSTEFTADDPEDLLIYQLAGAVKQLRQDLPDEVLNDASLSFGVYSHTVTKFGFLDRLRILFGRKVTHSVLLKLNRSVAVKSSEQTVRVAKFIESTSKSQQAQAL